MDLKRDISYCHLIFMYPKRIHIVAKIYRIQNKLKLDLYDSKTYKLMKQKNVVSNQYTLPAKSRFSHSDFGASPIKTYANTQTLWHTMGSNLQPLDYIPFTFLTELIREMFRVGFKFY